MNKIDEVFKILRESKDQDVFEWISKYKTISEIARYADYLEDDDFLDLTSIYSYFNDIAGDIPNLYGKAMNTYSIPKLKSFDSLSEAEESVNDETNAGNVEPFTYRNTYYPFSYLPVPDFMHTRCKVDTVSNKLVLPHKSSVSDISIKVKSNAGVDYYSGRDVVHTFEVFDGEHDLVISAESENEFNFIEFDIVASKGSWAEVTSALNEESDLLTKEIRIDHAKRIKLYFDPVKSIDVTIRLYCSGTEKNMHTNVANINAGLNIYTASSVKITTSFSGNFYFQTGYRMSEYSSISCSVLSDGKYYGKFYPISGETYYFDLSNAEIVINLSTQNNRSTPMLTYVRFGVRSVIADVF